MLIHKLIRFLLFKSDNLTARNDSTKINNKQNAQEWMFLSYLENALFEYVVRPQNPIFNSYIFI